MSLSEFSIIERYFTRPTRRADVCLGIGDDAALLRVPEGMELAVAVDTLVEGVHFPAGTAASDIGHKALAVNLSDLAAMGAAPAWATLSLTLPTADEAWLKDFAAGFFALAETHGLALVGGDTTRGPLAVSVTVHGLVPAGEALRRSGAAVGERVYVTGCLGDAGLALQLCQADAGQAQSIDSADRDYLLGRLHRPLPRVAQGLALRGLASACIDISDGLLADLGHILSAAGLGARLQVDRLPRSAALMKRLDEEAALPLALGAGDDYELCFTVPADKCARLDAALKPLGLMYTEVGILEPEAGIRCVRDDGRVLDIPVAGYRHF